LLASQQNYLLPVDAGGLDIVYANEMLGGLGDGVHVFDVQV
jgi:hypothetical protein